MGKILHIRVPYWLAISYAFDILILKKIFFISKQVAKGGDKGIFRGRS